MQATLGNTISIEGANFMSYLGDEGVPLCSACILVDNNEPDSSDTLFTSARCVDGRKHIDVYVGEANPHNPYAKPYERVDSSHWRIPIILGKTFAHVGNMAVIKLQKRIRFNQFGGKVGGLVLADKNYKLQPNKKYKIFGYGHFDNNNVYEIVNIMDHLRFFESEVGYSQKMVQAALQFGERTIDKELRSNILVANPQIETDGHWRKLPNIYGGDHGGRTFCKYWPQ